MVDFLKRSIQRKFVAIMFLALVAVNGPLLAIFFVVSSDSIKREMHAKHEAILSVNSKALSKPLWDFDFANLNEWASTIVLNPGIAEVEILDDNNQTVAKAVSQEATADVLGSDFEVEDRAIVRTNAGKQTRVGTLRITHGHDQINNSVWNEVGKSAILFIASTIAVLIAAVFANRMMIAGPLSRLTSTINATRRDGKRHKIAWSSADEIGLMASNFNEMQDKLEADQDKLRATYERMTFLYNNTPVMLYSVNDDDVILAVSDYWLFATGYRKEEVIGRRFMEFVPEPSEDDYGDKPRISCVAPGRVSETTCAFRRKDGTLIDIMIREAPDQENASSVPHSLSVMTDISNLKAVEEAMRSLALTDPLTGLMNRAGFTHHADQELEDARLNGGRVAALFLDLDRFKWVNDNLGHSAGDHVLQTVSHRIQSLLRGGDKFGRFGGDEFSVLISGDDVSDRATALAGDINRVLSKPFKLDGRRLSISTSVGISFYPDNATTADELLRTSDVAMYHRKREGRNGYCLFNEKLGCEASRYLEVEQFISDGLSNDLFELHFQPIVDLRTEEIIGFEGLLRLDHPEEGPIRPDEIIATAEQNGSIQEIGDRVLDLGIQHLKRLADDPYLNDTYVTINLSAAQFLPGLPAKLAGKLMDYGVDPRKLVLEITETVLMQQAPDLEHIFEAIRELGCTFALDDFGTGFSSLSYINRFPVGIVKIDRSFISTLGQETDEPVAQKTLTLIEGIRLLSHQLKIKVIAEGIETETQLRRLQVMGMDAGQGYHIGRPLPFDAYLSKGPCEVEGKQAS